MCQSLGRGFESHLLLGAYPLLSSQDVVLKYRTKPKKSINGIDNTNEMIIGVEYGYCLSVALFYPNNELSSVMIAIQIQFRSQTISSV